MLFGGNPEVPIRPEGEGTELEDGRVVCGDGIADGKRGGVEDAHVAA